VVAVRMIEAKGKRFVKSQVRNKLAKILRNTPGAFIDGTVDIEICKALLRGTNHEIIFKDIKALPVAGAYHYTLFPERPFGKSGLVTITEEEGKDGKKGKRHEPTEALWRIWRFIHVLAKEFVGQGVKINGRRYDGLIGVQEDVAIPLREMGLPSNVYVLTFGNERGVNKLAGVKFVVCVGRPMPEMSEILDLTEALHADNPDVLEISRKVPDIGEPRVASRTLPMVDGGAVSFPRERAVDPDADRVLCQFIDAAVGQMIARGRPFNKDASNRLMIYQFGQADIGLPIHEALRFSDADRDAADLMAAMGIEFDRQELAERFCEKLTGHGGWVRGTHGGRDAFAEQVAWLKARAGQGTAQGEQSSSYKFGPRMATAYIDIYTVGKSQTSSEFVTPPTPPAPTRTTARFRIDGQRYADTCRYDPARYRDVGQAIARLLDLQDVEIERDQEIKQKKRGRPQAAAASRRTEYMRAYRSKKRATTAGSK
jgi:hypothetical protein